MVYAVLIALVAAALIAMRTYFVRSLQEKYRQSADVIGEGEQYAPGKTVVTNLDAAGADNPEVPFDVEICQNIQARAGLLDYQIYDEDYSYTDYAKNFHKVIGLPGLIADYEATAVGLLSQAAILQEQGKLEQAQPMIEAAAVLREQESVAEEKIAVRQEEISDLKEKNPECF